MTLLEGLIGIGQGVARGILWLTLEDEAIARETGLSILEILDRRTNDVLAKRRGGRQFEQIAEQVAENLVHLFEYEATEIPEASRRAVVLAVDETITNTALPAEVLLERNLEPSRLESLFRGSHNDRGARDPARHFSSAEADLYHRVLSEVSQYIVDSASQMPSFRERSIAEILGRQDLILDRATQILDETRRLRETQSTQEASAARFTTEYRRAVVRKLDWLELFGVDVRRGSRRYRLNVAYVSLEVEQEQRPALRASPSVDSFEPWDPDWDPDDEATWFAIGPQSPVEEETSDLREIVPITEALSARNRLFVRGPAGSGKTTLLQWIAVQSARQAMEGSLDAWNAKVPFFVRLRELADRDLPAPEELVSLVSPAIAGIQPEGWVHDCLVSGDAVVLIDGLDEISSERRKEVKNWLEDLVGTFGKASFVLCGRPHAAEEGWLEDLEFSEADLRDLGRREIETFVDHWHGAIAEEVDESERGSLKEAAVHLKESIFDNRPLQLLATNPLLCALLCALHYDRQQDLPKDRIDLYSACYDMFLRRDRERRISMPDYPEVGDRKKRALLEDLAYHLIKNGWSEIEKVKADARLERKIGQLDGNPEGTEGSDLRRLLVERAGILREPTAEKIDFPHRTFQEFLAAKAALHEGDLGLLVERSHEVQWREVVLLAVGLGRKKEAEELVDGMLRRGDEEQDQRHTLYLLGAAGLDSALDWSPKILAAVEGRLKQVVPPKTFAEARELAAAGDLVVGHLAWNSSRKAIERAACVRALTLVGSQAALNTLTAYLEDSSKTVKRAFESSWSLAEDQDSYFERFLASDNHLRINYLSSRLEDLVQLDSAEDVEQLSIQRESKALSISISSLLPNFKS